MLRWDPEHPRALKTQVGALATGKHSQALFELGNRLANDHPDWPLSWYTVGCYYLTVGETGEAKYNFRYVRPRHADKLKRPTGVCVGRWGGEEGVDPVQGSESHDCEYDSADSVAESVSVLCLFSFALGNFVNRVSSKAGNMEPNFALAWVGVGHAALEEVRGAMQHGGESDGLTPFLVMWHGRVELCVLQTKKGAGRGLGFIRS